MKLTCQIETNEDWTWCDASVSLYRIFARRFNRKDIQWAKSQPYANKSGIYFLFGPQNEVPRRLYIGQAEKRQDESLGIVNRMNETPAHEKILDWTEGVMFVYTDDFLDDNPLKLRYLEHKFWEDANFILSSASSQSKFQLVNRCPRDGNIPEPVRDILNIFILYCKTILNFMGFPIYKIDSEISNERIINSTFDTSDEQVNISSPLPNNLIPSNNTASNKVHNSPFPASLQNNFVNHSNITTSENSNNQNNRIFYFKDSKDRFNATGKLEADNTSFTVLKGSRVILNPPGDKVNQAILDFRAKYAKNLDINGILLESITFHSRSQASNFVCLYSSNGNIMWKNSHGQTLGELFPTTNINETNYNPSFDNSEVQGNFSSSSLQKDSINQQNTPSSEVLDNQENRIFYFKDKKNRFNAMGKLEADNINFTVLKGSKVIINPPGNKVAQAILDLRAKYANKIDINGILIENITFNSRSQASNFVCLFSSNGNIMWVNKQGQTLGSLFPKNF